MFITTESEFEIFSTWLKRQDMVAFDIETSGLLPSNSDIIGFGVSNSSNGYYFPINFYCNDSQVLKPHAAAPLAKKALELLKHKKIMCFNGAFDVPFTEKKFGINLLPNLHTDVLLLKHTVDEEFPFKLKDIAVQVFGYGAASQQRDLHEELKVAGAGKNEIYKASWRTIGKYCVQDCLLTYRLYNHYRQRLDAEDLTKFFYDDEVMPLYREVTIPMENYGLRLDVPLMQSTLEEISKDIDALEQSIQEQIKPLLGKFHEWFLNKDYPASRSGNFAQGIVAFAGLELPKTETGKYSLTAKNVEKLPDSIYKDVLLKKAYLPAEDVQKVQWMLAKADHGDKSLFNLQSKHHLKKLFFDTLCLEPLSTTDLGNPQVDDEFIHSVAPKFPWANDLHIYNKLQKIRSTYIERFLEEQINGIFYPSFFQHRTISGRFGSDLQQLPRKVSEANEPSALVRKYVNVIRDFFVTRDGHKLIGADYESLEPHIFAHVSGDERLQNIFRQGLDFYSEIAIRTEDLTQFSSDKKADNYLGKVAKEKRQTAKAYALGIPYGMSGYKLAYELGIEEAEASKLVQKYLDAFPDLKNWMDNSQSFLIEHGYIKSQAGRIRHMPRAKEYAKKFGLSILDSLFLYKEFGHDPSMYEHMKGIRRELKNYINNCMNFQIQSLAASIVNRAAIAIMRELRDKGLKASLCMNVHDELVCEAPEAEVERVCEIMQRNMENIIKLSLPLHAEPQVATKYGDTK